MFIAMGAATLVGDALLHLLPQVNWLSDDILRYSGLVVLESLLYLLLI